MAKNTTSTGLPTLNFAAKEAYKRLRTNIIYSFTASEEKSCRVIGVTSSTQSEGKTTTAIEAAIALSENDLRVLVVDCDLRIPSVHDLVMLPCSPGLSNLLAGTDNEKAIVYPTTINANLFIMPAGEIPPNPSELLSSLRMKYIIDVLSKSFDYIILDLPPIGIVTDALVVSKITDGMIFVVRKNYADQRAAADCVKQLQNHGAHMLGFVFNYAGVGGKYYKSSYYYKKNK